MTYDQLVTLDFIVKCGSFKSASQLLHKSQPSLSVAMKKLEEQFQIKIFDRSGYRPVLTPEGKIFYEKAKLALAHMKSLELFGEELGMGVEAEVRVAIDGLAPLNKILCQLKNFFTDYSSTNLTLEMEQISGTIQKLLSQKIDIGFSPMLETYEDLEFVEIYKTKMIPVCSPTLIKNKKLSIETLRKLPQVVVTDSGIKSDKNFGVLDNARKWIVTSMDTKKSIVTGALGWGRLPDFLIEGELKEGDLKQLDLPEIESHVIKIYMIRNKLKPMGPITKRLWDQLKAN